MAILNYNDLIAKLNIQIKANGIKYITGPILNDMLKDLIDSVMSYGAKMFITNIEPTETNNVIWFDTNDNTIKVFDGSVWTSFGGSNVPSNPVFEYNTTDNILTIKWDGAETFLNVKGIIDENNNGIVLKSGANMAIQRMGMVGSNPIYSVIENFEEGNMNVLYYDPTVYTVVKKEHSNYQDKYLRQNIIVGDNKNIYFSNWTESDISNRTFYNNDIRISRLGHFEKYVGGQWVPITTPSSLTNYIGLWDANTNTPTITSGVGTSGDWYKISVTGSTNIDGINSWTVGDYIWFDSSTNTWQKIDNTSGSTLTVAGLNKQIQYNNNGVLGASSNFTFDTAVNKLYLNGVLDLPNTTSSTTGVITKNGVRFLHNFSHPTGSTAIPVGRNVFLGENAGNFTMGSTAISANQSSNNVGIGAYALYSNTLGECNVAIGTSALISNTTGNYNVAVGTSALHNNTTGYSNVAVGTFALYSNTTGYSNVAFGTSALRLNTTGYSNVAVGSSALENNTLGECNVAVGSSALILNTTGNYNVAVGKSALRLNTTGYSNVAVGSSALETNTLGEYNVAVGSSALVNNTTGYSNVAVGTFALVNNTTGYSNVAVGQHSLLNNTTGTTNIGIGTNTARFIADGTTSLTNATNSLYVGGEVKASADNINNENVFGYNAIGSGSNTFTFGTSSIVKNVFYGNIELQNTTTSTTGVITKNGNRFLHNFSHPTGSTAIPAGNNIFLGLNAGNFTMGSTATFDYYSSHNIGIGFYTLNSNTSGFHNTAIGSQSQQNVTSGSANNSIGSFSLFSNTTGYGNVAIGTYAGRYIADGTTGLTSAAYSLYLGNSTKASADNIINENVFGYNAIGKGSNTVNIGNTSITDTYLNGKVHSTSSVQVADDTTVASATNVGAIRYRTSGNNSYCDMVMQISANVYSWVNIKQNNWV